MAGGITDTGELYSPYVGLVYMFNLIVGTGALTMPKAFATAGWLVSLILIMFLGFMSYMTTTFVMEAMAAANAQLRWKRMEKHKDDDEDSSSGVSDSDVLLPEGYEGYERSETRPILSLQRRGAPNIFEITERVEMGQMASMFFNKVGVNLFYFCIIIYLYGDLAIYAAAVPVSLMQVTCSVTGNHSCSVEDGTKYNDTDKCWGPIRRIDAYRIYLAAFTILLGPFTFFNVQKTKYLQILTSLMRWIGLDVSVPAMDADADGINVSVEVEPGQTWNLTISRFKDPTLSESPLSELRNFGPVYLEERLHPHRPARTLRSSSEGLLVFPSL